MIIKIDDTPVIKLISDEVNGIVKNAQKPGLNWVNIEMLKERLSGMRSAVVFTFGKESEVYKIVKDAQQTIEDL